MTNPATEEEFWNGIKDYESLPQIKLDWNELAGFWKPDKGDAKTFAIGNEHGLSEKVEQAESKNDGTVTVMTKGTECYPNGCIARWKEYNT